VSLHGAAKQPFRMDDIRKLKTCPAGAFSVVLAFDNALPTSMETRQAHHSSVLQGALDRVGEGGGGRSKGGDGDIVGVGALLVRRGHAEAHDERLTAP
jgi:hypothetical protein